MEKKVIIILSIILAILILAVGGYIVYTNILNKDTTPPEIALKGEEISTFEIGDTIQFSEKEWIIINKTETAVGVILKDYLPGRIFCADMDTRYSLTDEESILYYLNTYFIKNLAEENLVNYNWKIGSYRNEESNTVNAKIGLLNRKEFISLEMDGTSEKFKVTDGNGWWLLTPSAGEFLKDALSIVTADNKTHEGWIKNTYVVKPVIYILNDTMVIE